MSAHPFERTVCACEKCTACCKKQPGPLAPGDYERIKEHMGATDETMKTLFWASPGAVVMDMTGNTRRVGTITPRFDRHKKRCVFLDEQDRCMIHAVAPFGCGYFDTHMSQARAMRRSVWLANATSHPDYQRLRNTLPFATHYKPSKY